MSRVDTTTAQSTSQSTTDRWLLALRVTATLQVAAVLMQGITAGQLVALNGGALDFHATGAIVIHVVAAIQTIAAFLLWRASRGPMWPTVVSALALVVGFIQAALGDAGNMKVHVPTALALTILISAVFVWSWLPAAKASIKR
jgi:hypothetical protein